MPFSDTASEEKAALLEKTDEPCLPTAAGRVTSAGGIQLHSLIPSENDSLPSLSGADSGITPLEEETNHIPTMADTPEEPKVMFDLPENGETEEHTPLTPDGNGTADWDRKHIGGTQADILELSTLITNPGLKRTESTDLLNWTLHQVSQYITYYKSYLLQVSPHLTSIQIPRK